jgi:thioredoxin-dependent peroxiredoxin
MEAYRDQYAKLFNNGKNVTVIGISTDADTTQASWAKEKNFPVLFASDPDQAVGKLYNVNDLNPLGKYERRVVFVVGPDGKITHIMRPFRVLADDDYVQLGEAVTKALEFVKP